MTTTSVEICKCGHPRQRHVMLRARCAVEVDDKPCGCVHFEPMTKWAVVDHAVTVTEQLELADKEIRRLRAQLNVALSDQPMDTQKAERATQQLREGLRSILRNPESTRASVQSAIFRLLEL